MKRIRFSAALISVVILSAVSAQAQSDAVELFTACVNGLQVDINGVASPGASVTSINWNWGDGQQTVGFFPESHTYRSRGQFIVDVTVDYSDGSTASASEGVSVAPRSLSNCVALSIAAARGGAVTYHASVGAATVPAGGQTTLQLDFADDVSLTATPNSGNLFSSWSASPDVTGNGNGPVDVSSPSVGVVVVGNSGITAEFAIPGQSNFPFITSVGVIPNVSNPRLGIEGGNFGTLPVQLPTSSDTPYFRIRDLTLGWGAGYKPQGALIGDLCTVTIYEWTPNKVAVGVNAGRRICPTPRIGDRIEIDLCSPESPSCVRSFSTQAVQAFENVSGQLAFTLFIPPTRPAAGIAGFSVGFVPANLDGITNGIVANLASQGIIIRSQDVGYGMITGRTSLPLAAEEADFLISAPQFFSDFGSVVQTAYEAPELLPIPLTQQFVDEIGPSPVPIVVEDVIDVGDAEIALKNAQANWCTIQAPAQLPEFLITRELGGYKALQVTITNLNRTPVSLSAPLSYYVVMPGSCVADTSGALEVDKVSPARVAVSLSPASH